MKKKSDIWVVALMAIAFVIFGTFAIRAQDEMFATDSTQVMEKKEPRLPQCPKTLVAGKVEDCLRCHVAPSFKVRESKPDATLDLPNAYSRIIGWEDKAIDPTTGKEFYPNLKGYFSIFSNITGSNAEMLYDFMDYLRQKHIQHLIIEIHSPGGSLFDAQRITGLMEAFENEGHIVETRVNGWAASAGFQIFVGGTIGHRFVIGEAELMWHEIQSFKMFDFSTPSDKKDEAEVLRHLQNTRNKWLSERSKLSKEEIDLKVAKKEFWMDGKQAVEYGFADGILSDQMKKMASK